MPMPGVAKRVFMTDLVQVTACVRQIIHLPGMVPLATRLTIVRPTTAGAHRTVSTIRLVFRIAVATLDIQPVVQIAMQLIIVRQIMEAVRKRALIPGLD